MGGPAPDGSILGDPTAGDLHLAPDDLHLHATDRRRAAARVGSGTPVESSLRDTRAALAESDRERRARAEAERAARENAERLREALDAAEMGTWDWDVATGGVTWTGCAAVLLGIPPGAPATIETFRDTIHPADRADLEDAIAAALAGPADEFQEQHRASSDPARWLLGRGRVYRDEAGRPLRMRGTVQDITAQKRAEQSIRESEAELRALVSAMTDMIFVLDRDGRYLGVAPSAPAPDLVGRRLHDVFPAQDADAHLARIRQCIDGQETVHVEYGMTIDGVQRWYSALASPLLRDSVVWVARDVTDRRRTEEQLRASEERWHRISEATFEGIAFSENGVMVDTNAQLAQILGYEPEELVGKPVLECVAPADRERVTAAIQGGRSSAYEHRALRKDGSTVLVETRARTLSFGGRKLRVTAVRDVSERSRLEGELRRQERLAAIGALVGGVAHEVRTPLFSISATLDALEARSAGHGDDSELKDLLRSQVKRLANLMQDLLEYGLLPRLQLERTVVPAAVRLAVHHCQPLASERDVHISTGVPESCWAGPRRGPHRAGARERDRERRRVLHAGTTVTISESGARRRARGSPSVSKTKAPASRPPISSRCSSRSSAVARAGTGLGRLAQRFVEAHGGTISARNREQAGAVFTLVLPVSTRPWSRSTAERLLIVDDEAAERLPPRPSRRQGLRGGHGRQRRAGARAVPLRRARTSCCSTTRCPTRTGSSCCVA